MRLTERRRTRRQRQRALAELPDLIELLVIAIRSGCTPSAALALIGHCCPVGLQPVVGEVRHRMQRGATLADALTAFSDTLGEAARPLVDGLATADRYGLPLLPVLDRLGDDIRTERRMAAERQARTLPVKLAFPLVVCTLPSFVLIAIAPALLGAVSTLRGPAA